MKKTSFTWSTSLKSLALLLSFTWLLSACEEDAILTPAPENPPVTTPTNPGTPDTEQPAPEQPTPGQPPVATGKFTKLKWSESDFQQVDYNESGLVTRYVSQYNSVQGSSTVSNFTYEFQYDASGRLVKETSNVQGTVDFFYNGNTLTKAIEYDKLNRPLNEHYYTYRSDNKLEERLTYRVALDQTKTEYQKQVYKYDARGNLVILEDYYSNPNTKQLELSIRVFFENFDDKKAPIRFLLTFPYLPQFTSWENNPRVKYAQNKNGDELVGRERYSYTYNADNLPSSQTRSVKIGDGRPDYTYTGNYLYQLN